MMHNVKNSEVITQIHDGQCALLLAILGMGIKGSEERRYPNRDEAIEYFSRGKAFIGEVRLPSYWSDLEEADSMNSPMQPESQEIDGQMSLFDILK